MKTYISKVLIFLKKNWWQLPPNLNGSVALYLQYSNDCHIFF